MLMKIWVYSIVAIVIVMVSACGHAESKKAALLNPQEGFIASLDTAHYTTIEWLDSAQNFGTIPEGDSIKLTYTFINTGNTPLFLSGVRTSCGCTIVNFPKEAVLPGHTEKLAASFNSKFHPGYMHKLIVVKSNTKNGTTHTLVMEGTVTKQTKK